MSLCSTNWALLTPKAGAKHELLPDKPASNLYEAFTEQISINCYITFKAALVLGSLHLT